VGVGLDLLQAALSNEKSARLATQKKRAIHP
jgi:hypothetical protein